MIRLSFFSTHPVQYDTPLFRKLAARPDVNLRVYYCHQASPQEQSSAGFGVAFDWDISLLGGYEHTFLENVSSKPATSGFRGMDVPGITKQIAEDKPDALIINGWHFKGAFQAMIACWRQGVPFLLRSDSQLPTARSPLTLAAKRLAYPRFIRRAGGFLPAGQLAKKYFLHYGAAPERIFIVPRCVDDERIAAAAGQQINDRERTRAAWNVNDEQIAWLFAGKFIEKKRPLDFVKTIANLNRENGNDGKSVGIMIGDGPLRRDCEEYARIHNVPIRCVGFLNQSEIAGGYIAGDALLLPSSAGETWGLVVNEAMLCGLPCFVSDQVGCGPDLIEEGSTGAVFPFGDPVSCARVLRHYASREVLGRMGETARSRCDKFSVNVVADALTQAVNKTIAMSNPNLPSRDREGAESCAGNERGRLQYRDRC
jgi:glycosyltransferase involved in cell wall biosynthesis